jgi:Fe-S-cluster containining protein
MPDLDLINFEKNSQEKWQENKELRNQLKKLDYSWVQNKMEQLAKEESSKIDCTQCARCCKGLTITPSSQDIKRLADYLEIEPLQFRLKYLKKDHEGDLVFKQRPCPFLKQNCCSVYSARPQTCRSYPHLEKSHMAGRGWHIVENTLVCPIVFNVYERIKSEISYHLPENHKKSEMDIG